MKESWLNLAPVLRDYCIYRIIDGGIYMAYLPMCTTSGTALVASVTFCMD